MVDVETDVALAEVPTYTIPPLRVDNEKESSGYYVHVGQGEEAHHRSRAG